MDAKALAKSKRAHSQHHSKKSHPSGHKPKAPSHSSENHQDPKKPLRNQVEDKSHQSRRVSELPSNSDRYDKDFDWGSENPSGYGTTSQPSDAILPKSKGADYHHLIAEAQAESESKLNLNPDSFTSLDDVLPDEFGWLMGSMLSARGEGILSWIGDDNFVVEEGTASTHEAAFLSLNLNNLAEQLEKVDLHQRLYVEADLLPPQMCADLSKTCSDLGSSQTQTKQENKAAPLTSEEPSLQDSTQKLTIADEIIKPTSLVPRPDTVDSLLSSLEADAVNRVKGESNSSQMAESSQSNKKFSTFEASSAEVELDMLLDSFGETMQEPAGLKNGNTFGYIQKEASKPHSPQDSGTNSGWSVPAPTAANFDDILDDLLEQTSSPMKPKGVSQPQENQTFSSSSSQTVRKSKVLDDFDSWLDTI